MDKLRHAIEDDADKLASRIEAADARRSVVFGASHAAMTGVERDLKEVEDYLSELERNHNGGPTSGADDSSESSAPAPRSSEVANRG
jgi:hypothetical protein